MVKVTKIIHMADIHLRNYQRHQEYKEVLTEFLKQAKDIADENGVENTRIALVGDLLHSKISTSNEQSLFLSWFLRECDLVCKTLIISGNHDFQENNLDRIDSITPIVQMLQLPNVVYLDMELEYKSGFYEDENIMWSVFSVFDNHSLIDIKLKKIEFPDKIFLSLFHGMTIGLKNDYGMVFDQGKSLEMFDGSSAVLCGDVHLRQEQEYNGIKIVQPGSVIQQNFGETVGRGHGYILWDLSDPENIEYEGVDLENQYGFYKFRLSNYMDAENGTEEFINF